MMAANEEFATEVERLYREEEKWEEERENLEGDRLKMEEEKVKLEGERDRLAETVKLVTFDNDRLLTEKLDEKEQHNKTIKELLTSHSETVNRLESQLTSLRKEKEDA